MPSIEIWTQAKTVSSQIRLRDVWRILKHLKDRSVVQCLSPCEPIGKIYYYTPLGCRVFQEAFGTPLNHTRSDMDWKSYSQVYRGKARRLLLKQMARPSVIDQKGKSASQIRKIMLEIHPMWLSHTVRTLKELKALKLVDTKEVGKSKTLYELTDKGRELVAELNLEESVIRNKCCG